MAKVFVDNYQNVQAQEKILILQNLDEIEIKFFIPEKLAIGVVDRVNPKIEIKFDANRENSYSGKVTEVATQADVQTQTYETTIRLPSPTDINVLPGMTAIVDISIDLSKVKDDCDCFLIPADAIFSDSDKKSYVWIVNDEERLEKRKIETKEFQDNSVLVEKGLKEGDTIVTAGVDFLRSNQLVKISE